MRLRLDERNGRFDEPSDHPTEWRLCGRALVETVHSNTRPEAQSLMLTRRSFLGEAAVMSAALAGHLPDQLVNARPADRGQGSSLRLLVLGGTQYVGPAIVEEALTRGHRVTLFNRGLTNPHLFPSLERLRGDRFPDRATGLSVLRGRQWDAVIDVCGFFPRQVRGTAELLRSSGRDVFAGRHAVVRAHSIQGPHDPGDGIRYWATRMGQGGDVLAPGTGRDAVQFIDVRDVAWLAVQGAEGGLTGTCNAIGPREPLTMSTLLEACQAVAGRGARLHWASEDFLRAQGIRSWGNMPLWAPLSEEAGFTQIDGSRAREAGFMPRPVEETIRGVLAATRLPLDYEFGARGGIPATQEQDVLNAWRRRG
jgi:2'-hydroxyisoflavone reductase